MDVLAMLFLTALILYFMIGACRILSMTFKTFSRSITIKNRKLAAMLIAYKNTWGIATSADKRNKMSLLGLFSYVILLPQIVFFAYDWWFLITTGVATLCEAGKTYLVLAGGYYMIAVFLKIDEANKFNKGEIW